MLFRSKGRLRKEYDQKLLEQLTQLKNEWGNQKRIVEKSIEPSEEVLYELSLSEVKYFFLLREAKKRKLSIGKFR